MLRSFDIDLALPERGFDFVDIFGNYVSEFGVRVVNDCIDDDGYPCDPFFVEYDRDLGAEWDYYNRY